MLRPDAPSFVFPLAGDPKPVLSSPSLVANNEDSQQIKPEKERRNEIDDFVDYMDTLDHQKLLTPDALLNLRARMAQLDYPYDIGYIYIPTLFSCYLTNATIGQDLAEDLPFIINCLIQGNGNIADPEPTWQLLFTKMQLKREQLAVLPEINRELFLDQVSEPKRLIDAASVGFVDHRFEHALVTIQRLIRYSASSPPPLYCEQSQWLPWYQEFEDKHHNAADSEQWHRHNVHLPSFTDIHDVTIVDGETSVLRWNRHLIFPYIEASCGIVDLVSTGHSCLTSFLDLKAIIGVAAHTIAGWKEERIRKLLPPQADLTYDFIHKVFEVRRDFPGSVQAWRYEFRDSLKFTLIDRNHNSPTHESLERKMVNDLMKHRFAEIESIVEVSKKCTAAYGTALLKRLAVLDIKKLQTSELKQWFLDITVKKIDILLIEFTEPLLEISHVEQFLRNAITSGMLKEIPKIISFLTKVIESYQRKIKGGLSPYPQLLSYYAPIVKMITI